MKGFRVAVVSAMVIVLSVVGFVVHQRLSLSPPAFGMSVAPAEAQPVQDQDDGEHLGVPKSNSAGVARIAGQFSERYASAPQIGDALTGAKTVADVEWLARNGYPSDTAVALSLQTRGAGVTLSSDRLLDPALLSAAEQLALNDPDRRDEAIQFLLRSAEAGSIYALETLSRIYQSGNSPDAIRAAAFSRAAEMRGNWAMAIIPARVQLSRQQDAYASLMAHQILEQITRDRARKGLPPLATDTRPGLGNLVKEMNDAILQGKR